MSTTVRISPKGYKLLRSLAAAGEASATEILDLALESYRRQQFLERAAESYAVLREDPAEWKRHQAEMDDWDAVAGDGLKGR